jgi:hypothetical protein
LRILGGIAAQGLQKFLGAGAGDGAQVIDHFGLAHADAVVLDGQVPAAVSGISVTRQNLRTQQFRLGQRLEAQLLAGIGGIRDQFAQKISLCEYSEWITNRSTCLVSAWNSLICGCVSVVMALQSV